MNVHATPRTFSFLLGLSVLLTAIAAIFINEHYTGAVFHADHFLWNVFFVNITFMGDAFFAIGMVFFLGFFLRRKKQALLLLQTLAVSLFIIQLTKIIAGAEGVHLYFEAGNPGRGSVPNLLSSHAAVAFTLAVFFAMQLKNPFTLFGIFIVAGTVAYSRMFLAGESLSAVMCGSIPAATALLFANRAAFQNKVSRFFSARKPANMGVGSLSVT
ncbi:MAG: phosphatase PAP2 family protein [Ferruginibacter sp.]